MGDILSQNEIDALLNAIDQGAEDKIPVKEERTKAEKKYDFKMPSKFNKEQLRTMELIFDNYIRLASSFLSGYLRTNIQMEVVDTSQTAFKEFSNSLISPDILGIVRVKPLKGSIILEMSPSIGYSIIDRILGGSGLGLKRLRDFSEIEKVLLDRVINHMLTYLPEAWENVTELSPSLEKLETNPQFVQFISPSEIVALITISAKIGPTEGFINFCLPNLVLEPVMDKLYTKYWFNTPADDNSEAYAEMMEIELEKTTARVNAVIGNTYITVNDFINLQVGDIIPLDSYINSDIKVMVGNLCKFYAKPGLSRGKYAVQITSAARKEE
ncbi:MAG: flagellar motor switch protein FliM [Clostridiales bacterium]|nr:flagellar motor switch protein FliM [Clostridiales bacterium]